MGEKGTRAPSPWSGYSPPLSSDLLPDFFLHQFWPLAGVLRRNTSLVSS